MTPKRALFFKVQSIVYTSVSDGLCTANLCPVADIEAAIKFESTRMAPRVSLISGLKTILRRKQREALNAPKEAA